MLNIVIIGPPGAGKGTQSQYIKDKYNLTYLSTGDILREEIAAGTDVGKMVDDIIKHGKLVPDEIVVSIIRHKVLSHLSSPGFLFDGFPRTVHQAVMLDDLMKENNLKISAVLSLDVSVDVLTARMLERAKTSGRSDDNEETIVHRLREYNDKTKSVLDYYEKKGNLHTFCGDRKIEEVFKSLCEVIDEVK